MLDTFIDYIEHKNCADRIRRLKRIFASGEALSYPIIQKFQTAFSDNHLIELHNLYWPTEATVDATYFEVDDEALMLDIFPTIGSLIDYVTIKV